MEQESSMELVVCVRNEGYEASLERRKLYQSLPDPDAANHGQVRVIDESGDDYLYPEGYFIRVRLPKHLERAILGTA